jgi:predicted DNA-binding transcriptional regulator YafY
MPLSAVKFERNFILLLKMLYSLTNPCGTTIKSLEDELDVSRRTVYRNITTLTDDLNLPVTSVRHSYGGETVYKLDPSYTIRLKSLCLPRLTFSRTEAAILHLLLKRDAALSDSELADDLSSLREKINLAILATNANGASGLNLEAFNASSPAFSAIHNIPADIIDTITQALEEQRECEVHYSSFSNKTSKTYIIQPLRLLDHRNAFYLFVRIPKHDIIRILSISRINAITLTDQPFEPPADFDPEAKLAQTFDLTFDDPIEATIYFSPTAAPYVRERYLSGQSKITDQPDGSCILHINTSGQNDLLRWMLSFGPDAVIQEPDYFRERARQYLLASLANYGDQS